MYITTESISKKICDLLAKNQRDSYEPICSFYNGILIYQIEVDGENVIYEGVEDDFHPLNDITALIELYNEMRVEFNDISISELTKEQVCKLVQSITWNSMFISDYINDLGVNAKIVSNFADSFIEYKEENLLNGTFKNWLNKTSYQKIGEEFYDYIQSFDE